MFDTYNTFNTYGMLSIHQETFNMKYNDSLWFLHSGRNWVVTGFRINNAILNVLGYIPAVSFVSGCVRMAIGAVIVGVTVVIGDPQAKEGAIIGRWYTEAVQTGIAQIVRGALEALVPFGKIANMVLDIIATPINLGKTNESSFRSSVGTIHRRPHSDPVYPFPFQILYFV